MSTNNDEKNKNRCKRYREKLKEDAIKLQNNKLKNRERMRNYRQKWKDSAKGNNKIIETKRQDDRIRKRKSRENAAKIKKSKQIQNEPYKCKQTLAKAVKKVEEAMPGDIEKKRKVLEVLSTKYKQPPQTNPNTNASTTLPESLFNSIQQFYANDNVSVQASGKKDTIFIGGELIAKRFMIMTVGEAYELYKKEYADEAVGKSTFFNMRPRYVQLVNKTPHNMCVCMYHANFGYSIESCAKIIPTFPRNFESFLKSVCCNIKNENCITGNCNECLTDLKNEYIPLAYLSNMEDEVNWQNWKKVDNRILLTKVIGTFSDLIVDVGKKLPSFKTHFFVKRANTPKKL